MYYGGEIFFEILEDAGVSDQIQKSQSARLKVQRIAQGWLARKHFRRLRLRQATALIRGSPEAITKMGLPQWQGWAAVHSVKGFKDYSGDLSTVYVSRCDNKNVGGPNVMDLAIHMANYQPVLIGVLCVRFLLWHRQIYPVHMGPCRYARATMPFRVEDVLTHITNCARPLTEDLAVWLEDLSERYPYKWAQVLAQVRRKGGPSLNPAPIPQVEVFLKFYLIPLTYFHCVARVYVSY